MDGTVRPSASTVSSGVTVSVLSAVWRHVYLAILVWTALMAVIALALALAPRSYTSTTIVGIVPRPDAGASGELVRLAVPTYASLAGSDAVAADVAERLSEDRARLEGAIRVDNPPSTNNVLISVTWDDPGRAAELANEVADEVLLFSVGDPLLTGFVVAPAVPATGASSPRTGVVLILGVFVALAGATGACTVADRRRRSVDVTGTSP